MPLPKVWAPYDRLTAEDLNADLAYLLARAGDAGAAFPSAPVLGDRFYRTDHKRTYFWDGTRWLSEHVVRWQLPVVSVLPLAATTTGSHRSAPPPIGLGSDFWIETILTHFLVGAGTALGASHKWVGVMNKATAAAGGTLVDTANIDSGAVNTWRRIANAPNALLGPLVDELEVTWTKTGTPGTLYAFSVMTGRIVG